MTNNYQKHKKDSKKKHAKVIKIFTKEEKLKRYNESLSEERKQKLFQYRRNYYLTHSK